MRVQLILSALLPAAAFIAMLLLLQIAPFGDKTFLYDDMKRQYVDYYSYYKDIILSKDDFFYSFSNGLGGEMFSSMAYYLLSPLLIPFIFLPRAALPTAITILIGCKLCFCSLFAFIGLHDLEDGDSPWILALSFAYAFNAYTALNASNIMWMDVVAVFPLLLMTTRWILEGRRFAGRYFAALLCASLVMNFYITYMVLLYLGIYVLLHARKVQRVWTWIFGCVVSAGLTACVMLPTFLALMDSGKNTTRFGDPIPSRYLNLGEILSKALTLSTDGDQIFQGNPHIYCGLLVLFGLVFYLLNRNIETGKRARTGVLMAIVTLSMMIAPVNRIWHGFASPEGFLYRFSFLLIYTALECAWVCINHVDGITRNRFVLGCGMIFAFMLPVFYRRFYYLGGPKKGLNAVLLIVFGGMLGMLLYLRRSQKPFIKHICGILVWLLLLFEMGDVWSNFVVGYAYASYGQDFNSEFIAKTSHDAPILAAIEAQDQGFYRIENENPRTENDAFQYNTNGVNVYTSMTPINVREFMHRLGYNDNHFFATYTTENMAAADAIFGVRYIVSNDHWSRLDATLPIIFADERSVEELTAHSGETEQADNPFSFAEAILGTYMGREVHFLTSARVLDLQVEDSRLNPGKDSATFHLETVTDGSLYFYVQKLDHSEDMTLLVNGKESGSFGNASCTNVLNLGTYQAGERVTVQIDNIERIPAAEDFLFVTEDEAALENVCKEIPEGTVSVQKIRSSHLKLETNEASGNAQSIVMAIPYENNWVIRIDGKKVEPIELFGVYMAIPLPGDGQMHHVDLRYWPKGFRAGTVITALTIGAIAAYLLWKRREESGQKTARTADSMVN